MYKLEVIDNGVGNKVINDNLGKNSENTKIIFSGSNNIVNISSSARLNNFLIKIRGDNNNISIGEGCNMLGVIDMRHNGSIVIEDNVSVGGGFYCVVGDGASLRIGSNSLLSSSVTLRVVDDIAIFDRVKLNRINYGGNIDIGEYVFIGKSSTIMKGVKIGRGSVIDVNSVVDRSVNENVLISGNPAKPIRNNIIWSKDVCLASALDDRLIERYR